jgi:hypothetical protein
VSNAGSSGFTLSFFLVLLRMLSSNAILPPPF